MSDVDVYCPCCGEVTGKWTDYTIGPGVYDYWLCPRCGSAWRVEIGFWDVTPEEPSDEEKREAQ